MSLTAETHSYSLSTFGVLLESSHANRTLLSRSPQLRFCSLTILGKMLRDFVVWVAFHVFIRLRIGRFQPNIGKTREYVNITPIDMRVGFFKVVGWTMRNAPTVAVKPGCLTNATAWKNALPASNQAACLSSLRTSKGRSMIECKSCPHRKWSEGDPDYSPPGYGCYYCDLTTSGGLSEEHAKRGGRPDDCPLINTQGFAA